MPQGLLNLFPRNDVYVTGANLHVVNGLAGTETGNGLGNLVVGYNEPRVDDGDPQTDDTNNRAGSHRVVVGSGLNYSYSAYGGLFASVAGGESNEALGAHASIGGGYVGTAAADHSSVSGGYVREIPAGVANQYPWRAGNVLPSK